MNIFRLIIEYTWLIQIVKELLLVLFAFVASWSCILTWDDYHPPQSAQRIHLNPKKNTH
jgi:hypothetical protein